MTKKIPALILIMFLLPVFCSCALLKGTLDERSGFTGRLMQTERYITEKNWNKAAVGLKDTEKSWKELKPILQIDIDHDYVNEIEDYFVIIEAAIENEDKIGSLTGIRLIQKKWDSIGEM